MVRGAPTGGKFGGGTVARVFPGVGRRRKLRYGNMAMRFINKGSLGCALGLAVMMASAALAGIIFIKCFGLAYKPEHSLTQYVSALFTRHALSWYLGTGVLFALGLWLTINAMITILKDFFEV